jgi:hypothetical protein
MKRNFKRSQYINTRIVFSLNIKTLNFLEKSILLGYLIRNFQRMISYHKKKKHHILIILYFFMTNIVGKYIYIYIYIKAE